MELPAHLELTPAWRDIHARLRGRVGDSTYEIWLSPLQLRNWDGQVMVLDAPPEIRAWVAKRYRRLLETSVREVLGPETGVVFAPDTSAGPPGGRACTAAPAPGPSSGLNPRYCFDQFVIGRGNRLAHAAALAVAELPGQAYNPLFLHAPSGLGKTHLLHAIGNYVRTFGDGATVRYTTVEAFTNHFITAISSRSVERFKNVYRDVDVLLIDDIQFLASKAKTEEEFFHTFNALYQTGRQLVLTADRLPRQLVGLGERLRERFESGLVAELEPPDFITRLTILRKRAALDGIALADDSVLELIAERITNNVRTLEGALIKVVAQHSLNRHPIDLALAGRVLDELAPLPTSPALTIDIIQAKVAGFYEISVSDLVSANRKARISWARHVAIHLVRDLLDVPLEALGRAFGGRSHATVLHAIRRVSEGIAADQQAADELAQIRASLTLSEVDRVC